MRSIEAMRPGGLERRGLGYEALLEVNPAIVFCTISGYGATGPYKDMPSHGIAYDVWAGLVQPEDRRRRLLRHARAPVDRHPRRAAVRCARRPGRRHPGPGDGRGLTHRDRSVRRRCCDGLAAQRDVEGLRATRVGGHGQQGRRLRAASARHRRHARRRALPVLRDSRRARPLPGVGAGVLAELLRRHRSARPVRAPSGFPLRRPRPREHASCAPSCAPSSGTGPQPNGWRSATAATRRSPRSTRPARSPTTPSSRRGCRGSPREALGPTGPDARSSWWARSCRCRQRRRQSASTPTLCCADVLGYDDARMNELRQPALSAER